MEQQLQTISLDADLENSDWTKQSWDLPPYKSPEFFGVVHDLEAFKLSPVYKAAVDQGLIHDDEWVADWVVLEAAPGDKSLPHSS